MRSVLVGVGQVTNRFEGLDGVVEPLELMVDAARAAVDDAGSDTLAAGLDAIAAVDGAWRYPDPAALVAERLGATDIATFRTYPGGDVPQVALGCLAQRIAAGEIGSAMIVGGEAIYGRRKLRAAGQKMGSVRSDWPIPERIGADLDMAHSVVDERGFDRPAYVYPLFESAIRASRGESFDQERDRLGRLWARFNEVAVENSHSWSQEKLTPEQIVTATDTNKMIGYPYTLAMNSNWFVDQAAAVIVASEDRAADLGIDPAKWVYVHSVATGSAPARIAERDRFDQSPAIRETATAALSTAGASVNELGLIDLYSCFPSVVHVTAQELGLSTDRPLTVTGGLTFAGGPLNNYVTHSLATMVEELRGTEDFGLVHANGGYATKQAFGVYSTTRPTEETQVLNVQDRIDRYPTRWFDESFSGNVTVEAYTVVHNDNQPERLLVSALTPTGARALGSTANPRAICASLEAELVGQRVRFAADGTVEV